MTLDDKANEVSTAIVTLHQLEAGSETPFLDFLKEMFAELLPMLIGCLPKAQRTAANVAKALNTPTLRQRAGLRFQLRKSMADPRTGNLRLHEVEDALYAMGKDVSVPQAALMMTEVA